MFAQQSDGGLWLTTSYTKKINTNWSASIAIQPRFNNDIENLERVVISPSVNYLLDPKQTLTLGYDAHIIDEPVSKLEQRIWQKYTRKVPGDILMGTGRVRLEERFIEDVDGTALRLRLKAGVRLPLSNTNYDFIISDEYFINVNDLSGGPEDGFDQNLFFFGCGRSLTNNIKANFGYQMQHINRPVEDLTIHQLFISFSYK